MKKNIFKSILAIVATIIFAIGFTACAKDDLNNPEDGVLTISATTMELDVFEAGRQLNAKYDDVSVAATWETSSQQIVTVENGLVVPVGEGTTVISASYNGQTATCTVIVKKKAQRPVIWVSSDICDLAVGGKVGVQAQIRYGQSVIDAVLNVKVESEGSVQAEWKDGKIVVQGLQAGTGTITVSGTCRGFVLTPVTITVSVVNPVVA